MKKYILILVAIVVLAAALRLYRLGDYPALNADEAALGYNAYSLIQTGKDEHGNPWPIHFQSFNDYKPGLYVYLDIPFVYLFGLNEWSVRLPGAFAGILSVLVLYFLVKELMSYEFRVTGSNQNLNSKNSQPVTRNNITALLSAFFLALSPWHLHFSRGAWEVNMANFFVLSGVWLFLLALRKNKYYILSFICFILSLYTYHAARLIAPLLVIGLFIIYRTEIFKVKGLIFKSALATGVFLIPLGLNIMGPAGLSRAAGVGLLADPGPINRIEEQRGEHEGNYVGGRLMHNKLINYGLTFLGNWGKHFYGEFLFLNGDQIERNKVPETGQLYLIDFIFLLTAIVMIAKRPKNWSIIFFWLFITPIPAALTFQSPHALRSFALVIPLIILSAYGCYSLLKLILDTTYLKKLMYVKYLLLLVMITLFSWNVFRYLHEYYIHMAKDYPYSSQYGIKNLVSYLNGNAFNNKSIVVTDRYDQPYILFLFYLKYPPAKFQSEHQLSSRDAYGFSTVRQFGRYSFLPINYDQVRNDYTNSIITGTDTEIPNEANIIKRIYENNFLYFKVVAN